MRPIGAHDGKDMYRGSFRFRSELGFLNCDDICMCLGFTNPVGAGEYGTCVCVWVVAVCVVSVVIEWGFGAVSGPGSWPGSGSMGWCLCEVRVWILCVDGRSRYLCIVLGGYLRI